MLTGTRHDDGIDPAGRPRGAKREEVLRAHVDRLRRRSVVDAVEVATYDREPVRELRAQFERVAADTVYAVPMCAAHTHETTDRVPRALSYLPGDVRYCEPIGGVRP
ncbi:hypothetical protein ACFQL4_27900 [Halosimplex aquaticum]